jgi:alkylhydroperoxidase family enzyme
MARLPYPDASQLSDKAREALASVPPLNIFRMIAHAETAVRPWLRFGGAILTRLQLDPQLRELAILQVAHQAEAEYEWVQHVAIARHVGVTDAQIDAIRNNATDDDPALGDQQRAILAFTGELIDRPRVSDPTFAAVNRWLTPREIVELMLTIGQYLMLARVMTTLELELDDPAGGRLVE